MGKAKKDKKSKKNNTEIKYKCTGNPAKKLSKESVEEANRAFKKKLFPI